jgi:hypothetical protein
MPFQPGNQEAKKGKKAKLYRDALNMELAAAGDDFKEIREIARAHINAAKSGDMSAIKEFADRMEGKVPQAIAGIDEDESLAPLVPVIRLTIGTQSDATPEAGGSVPDQGD